MNIFNKSWNCHYGKWWAVQWQFDSWFSLGVHLETKKRITAKERIPYGPYVDFHLGVFIVSLGRNPIYSTDIGNLTYRDGYNGNAH